MISPAILRKFGTTRERLRVIFEKRQVDKPGKESTPEQVTAYEEWDRDTKIRKQFEEEIQSTLQECVEWGLKNYQFYAAVDIAWDTSAVTREMLPLLLYAQSKINVQACANQLSSVACGDQFVKKDAMGTPTAIDLPKFVDVSINMVRSTVRRRHAAQSVKYSNLYPSYKYESRSTGLVGKLRADVMSQEAEIMVDSFGYRHHDSQVMRDALLYGHSVDFIRSAWEIEKAYEPSYASDAFKTEEIQAKAYIKKEGLSWFNPHPTRLIKDDAEPLALINEDIGPKYIGYWDVVRYGTVADDPNYFNKESISYGQGLLNLVSSYNPYFSQYFCNIKLPPLTPTPVPDPMGSLPGTSGQVIDVAGQNDRKAILGVYGSDKQMAMFKAEYFRKLVPIDHGMGDYPFPMWIRFVVASDSTVIYAEPLPSTPAAYCGINESDGRQINPSFAHDVMWAQDLMSNLVTQMMSAVQGELLKILWINTDVVEEANVKRIESVLSGRNWAVSGPIVIPGSLKKLADEMDLKTDALFKIGETRQGQSVDVIFKAMAQLLSLMERMEAMSPAEQGQPAPREISATEVTEIAGTTQNVYGAISDAIDEFRSAKKRIIYESIMCHKEGMVQVPVINRYSKETIQKAGFAMVDDTEEAPGRPSAVTVIGSKQYLRHDYIFTTRDGAERPVNTQAANSLVQLMQVVLQVPVVLEGLGREQIYNIFNEIFRLSGTGVDLNLQMQEGDGQGFGADQIAQMGQLLQQLQAALQQLAQATQKNAQDVADQGMVNQRQEAMLDGLTQAAQLVKQSAGDIHQLLTRVSKLEKAQPVEVPPYDAAPEEIRRQLEQRAGFVPPTNPHYLDEEMQDEALAAQANNHATTT